MNHQGISTVTSRSSVLLLIIMVTGLFGARTPVAAQQITAQPTNQYVVYLPLISNGSGAQPGGATSEELIDAAISRGEIDADTGLVYKIFAEFTDPRLPQVYRGVARDDGIHSSAGDDLKARYQSLNAEQQALMAPFLVPPMHQGSWWQQRYAPNILPNTALAEQPVDDSSILDTKWSSILVNNNKVRIWWETARPQDAPFAAQIGNEITQKIWPELVRLMGREPLSDNGAVTKGRGGDNAFDIILYQGSSKVWTYDWCSSNSPGYMLYNRDVVDWQEELAHEMMHIFQFAFNTSTGCVTTTYRWLSESTAQWFPERMYPTSTYEHIAAKLFLDEPHLALDTVQDNGRHYGAYLAWLYIDKILKQPAMIGQLWRNTESYGPTEVVEKTFPGGFEKLWPKVLLHNWNRDLYDQYFKLDGMNHRPVTVDKQPVELRVAGSGLLEYPIPVEVERLAGAYYHYTFPVSDTNTRLITFYNGITYDLNRERVAFAGRSFDSYVWEQAPVDDWQGASIQALFKVNGGWMYEDWSGKPYRTFCRDKANERIEELVLIVGNSRWQNTAFDVEDLNDPSAITASNIGCWRYEGSAATVAAIEDLDKTVEAADVVFEAIPPVEMNIPTTDPSRIRRFLWQLDFRPLGGDLSLRGSVTDHCGGEPPRVVVGTLSGNAPVRSFAEGNAFTNLRIHGFTLGGPDHRHYEGSGISLDLGSNSQTCDGPMAAEIGLWWETRRLEGRPAPASGVLSGSYELGDGVQSTWNFNPQRQ